MNGHIVWGGKGNTAGFMINLVGRKLYEWTTAQSPQNSLVASLKGHYTTTN